MKIFNLGKKKTNHPKTRKRMTKAERRKNWAEEQLMARAKTDPIAESAMILRETGVSIPPIDEIKQGEKKLDEKITKMAFEEIESDETLKKRATAMKIQRILGSDPRDEHGEEGPYYPSESERGALDTIREYRELEREFGSGTGAFSFLKDPEVITQLLIALRSIFPDAAGATAMGVRSGEGKTIVVEVDGCSIEMSQPAYQAYRAQREQLHLIQSKLKQLAGDKTSDVDTEGQSGAKSKMAGNLTEENHDEEAGITPFVSGKQPDVGQVPEREDEPGEFNIGEFVYFAEEIAIAMKDSPKQFAEDLAASAKGGNQDAQMLLLFLSTVTYDQLIELVKPYEKTEGLPQFVNKLTDSKEWVEEALASIKQ